MSNHTPSPAVLTAVSDERLAAIAEWFCDFEHGRNYGYADLMIKETEMAEVLAALRELQSLRSLRAGGWRPIESAPKNDQWILIRGRNSANKPMIPIVAAWHPPGAMTFHGWVDCVGFRDVNEYAVEWMPLPPHSPAAEDV